MPLDHPVKDDGSQTIDVENDRTYDVVAELMQPHVHALRQPRRAA